MALKICPHVGQKVKFYPGVNEGVPCAEGSHLVGIVAHAHTSDKVNVHVYDMHATSRPFSNVPYFHGKPVNDMPISYCTFWED